MYTCPYNFGIKNFHLNFCSKYVNFKFGFFNQTFLIKFIEFIKFIINKTCNFGSKLLLCIVYTVYYGSSLYIYYILYRLLHYKVQRMQSSKILSFLSIQVADHYAIIILYKKLVQKNTTFYSYRRWSDSHAKVLSNCNRLWLIIIFKSTMIIKKIWI